MVQVHITRRVYRSVVVAHVSSGSPVYLYKTSTITNNYSPYMCIHTYIYSVYVIGCSVLCQGLYGWRGINQIIETVLPSVGWGLQVAILWVCVHNGIRSVNEYDEVNIEVVVNSGNYNCHHFDQLRIGVSKTLFTLLKNHYKKQVYTWPDSHE